MTGGVIQGTYFSAVEFVSAVSMGRVLTMLKKKIVAKMIRRFIVVGCWSV